MEFWTGKRVLVTGASGFLGRHLMAQLAATGATNVSAPSSAEFDLRKWDDLRRLFESVRPDLVIHLAARVGGIGANQANPGVFFYDNAIMGIQLLEVARLFGVGKVVTLGTVCAYPKVTAVPFREEDLWTGYPEETNAPYGLAKKMLLVQGQAYRQQYGFNSIHLLPANLYGPGDHFDLERSHVIPALIRKFLDAKRLGVESVVLWGTGEVSREFLYVKDAARAIVMAAESYDGSEPVNLGTGIEIRIRDLAGMIRRLVGYEGHVIWDQTRPDGQPRRQLNTDRAKQLFGFAASTDFETGLPETIEWYQATLGAASIASGV